MKFPFSKSIRHKFAFCVLLLICNHGKAQSILEADGPGNTYELINSVLAPGYDAVEEPDCDHLVFGRHIDEIWDADLNSYVFRFHMHKSPDSDRCINYDRQRNEIKTYNQSPDSLLGVLGETVVYQWKFKLDSAFQPSGSFTHLHQIKAVGGPESSMPLITLTARKASPDRIELRYADTLTQSTLHQTDLAPLLDVWLDVTETILYEEVGLGTYEVLISNHLTGDTLFHYANNALRMWKTNADFQRPKWGVYRSLNDSTNLRDEEVLFADFVVQEIDPTLSINSANQLTESVFLFPNPVGDDLSFVNGVQEFLYAKIYTTTMELVWEGKLNNNEVNTKDLPPGLYVIHLIAADNSTRVLRLMKE